MLILLYTTHHGDNNNSYGGSYMYGVGFEHGLQRGKARGCVDVVLEFGRLFL